MRCIRGGAVLLLVVATSPLGAASPPTPSDEPETLRPSALSLPKDAALRAPLFVRADRQGRTMLVGGADLRALPLLPNGKLGEALPHESTRLPNGPPLRFAMSRDGDWLVLAPPEVRLLRGGKQTVLPALEWSPIAAFSTQTGPWKLECEELETARWKPVRNLKIDRQEAIEEGEGGAARD